MFYTTWNVWGDFFWQFLVWLSFHCKCTKSAEPNQQADFCITRHASGKDTWLGLQSLKLRTPNTLKSVQNLFRSSRFTFHHFLRLNLKKIQRDPEPSCIAQGRALSMIMDIGETALRACGSNNYPFIPPLLSLLFLSLSSPSLFSLTFPVPSDFPSPFSLQSLP